MSKSSKGAGVSRIAIVVVIAVASIGGFLAWGYFDSGHKSAALDNLRLGEDKDAEDVFTRIIKANPKDFEAIYYRGIARARLGKPEEALTDFAMIRSQKDWAARSFYRTVEIFIQENRATDAKAEVESRDADFSKSSVAQEAIGRYYMWEATRGIDRIQKILAPVIGDRPADRMQRYAQRVVYADSKIYAGSLDKFLDRLSKEYEFNKGALLTTIIDRAHDNLLNANLAFKRASSLAQKDETQQFPLVAHKQLADIFEVRRRMADFERHLAQIVECKKEDLNGEILWERSLKGRKEDASLRLAQSRLDAKAYEDTIDEVLKVEPTSTGRRIYAFERLLAQAHRGLGNDEKALEIARYWLSRQPKFPTCNFIVGSHLFEQGDFDKAHPYLELAVGRSYTNREYTPVYVQCLLKLGRFDRANGVLDQILKFRPDDWESILLKAQAMEGLGWIEDARTYLNKMLGSRFSATGTKANRALRDFMEKFIARNDLLPKDLHTAQMLYREDENNFDIGRRYLDLLVKAGAVENARTLARDLFRRCPEDDSARFEVMMSTGKAFETLRKHGEATVSYNDAAKRKPYSVDAHIGIARNEIARGNVEPAARALSHASTLAPDLVELHRIRFDILMAEERSDEALVEARKWIKKGGTDGPTLRSIADLLLQKKDIDQARSTIAIIESQNSKDIDDKVSLAMLQLRAGLERKAISQLNKVCESLGFGLANRTQLCEKFAEIRRHDLVIKYLSEPVLSDKEADSEAVLVLAKAYRESGQVDQFLDLLSRLRRRGRNHQSYTWAAEFCAKRNANREILSIGVAAVQQGMAHPDMLEVGIVRALKLGERKVAVLFLDELKKHQETSPGRLGRMKAKLMEFDRQIIQAVVELRKTLTKVGPDDRAPIWIQLAELLVANGQLEEMKKAISEAVLKKEVPATYSARAARLLIKAADASAAQAVAAAVSVAPESPDAWFDAGIIALINNDLDGATTSFKKSFELRPDYRSTHALSMIAAFRGDQKLWHSTMRRRRGKYEPYVSPDTPDMTSFVHYLAAFNVRRALNYAELMTYPSVAEKEALISLIKTPMANREEQREFAGQLMRFLVLASNGHTVRSAAPVARELEKLKPNHKREIRLMEARALMATDETYMGGIRIVQEMLNQSNFLDEAALTIYAQNYVKSGQKSGLKKLVDLILSKKEYSDDFKIDLASLLSRAGQQDDAARLLYTCGKNSLAKTRQEAVALFKSGFVDRAAELLKAKIPTTDRAFEYHYIVGVAKAQNPATKREGYELLRSAVYRFGALDDEVHLAFAKEAFAFNETEEARKNIAQYLKRAPASAERVIKAANLVQTMIEPDPKLSAKLSDRRFLLDPTGYFE